MDETNIPHESEMAAALTAGPSPDACRGFFLGRRHDELETELRMAVRGPQIFVPM